MIFEQVSESIFPSLSRIGLPLMATVVLGGALASAASAEIAYTVTDLGAPSGGTTVTGRALNNSGQVTGFFQTDITVNFANPYGPPTSSTYNTTLAFLYSNGTSRSLGSLGDPTHQYSEGFDINSAGQVTGETNITPGTFNNGDPGPYTMLYSNGGLTTPVLGVASGDDYSRGYSINDSGSITGNFSGAYGTAAFVYPGIYTQNSGYGIGTLGGSYASGSSINNFGLVTGSSTLSSGAVHAFRFDSTQYPNLPQDLGTLPGYQQSAGSSINDRGQIVGSSYNYVNGVSTGRAFLYENGQMQDLGTLGGSYSNAYSLNNNGVAVGFSTDALNANRAVIYNGRSITDLNSLIDSALGIVLTEARDINDNGQIVANGGGRAYLLTPVPEPSSILGLLAFGLSGGVVVRRRQLAGRVAATRAVR